MKQTFTCPVCGKEFFDYYTRVYCSRVCKAESMKREKSTYTCKQCGKEFQRHPSNVHFKNVYCSRECFAGSQLRGGCSSSLYKLPIEKRRCYMKEARAIISGKNTYGKNKCVDLPDEPREPRSAQSSKKFDRRALMDCVLNCLSTTTGMSWKELFEATGKPAMSTLSYAVRVLEQAGKVERERVVFPPKYNYKEDRTHAARVLIKRKA